MRGSSGLDGFSAFLSSSGREITPHRAPRRHLSAAPSCPPDLGFVRKRTDLEKVKKKKKKVTVPPSS